jgi:hypothetical protein
MRSIRVLDDPLAIAAAVRSIRGDAGAEPFLCETGGSAIAFCASVFPDSHESSIQVRRYERCPTGRGLHFDVFGDLLDRNAPWIGVFNLAGRCRFRCFALPPYFADLYRSQFPGSSEQAYHARRAISNAALAGMTESPAAGVLAPRSGFVLPQRSDGFQWVHEVVPCDPSDPGAFLKFVVTSRVDPLLAENGYVSLGELLTRSQSPALERTEAAAAGGRKVPGRCEYVS